jgi:hypothetical protein
MAKTKTALIIGTEVSTNGFESGGSLRIDSIRKLLEAKGFDVTVTSRATAKNFLSSEWNLVTLVSFSTAKFLRLARKRGESLWFDPTDSWTLTRLSLLKNGDLKQVLLFLRDMFWVWTSPTLDLVTFISERDATRERFWWKYRKAPVIYGIHGLDREIFPASSPRLVFIGDGDYSPNNVGLDFLSRVLDFLPPTTKIHLFGRNLVTDDERFVCHGYSSTQELYFENDIHLAPIAYGGGLKLKVAIPLWNGLRVVSTPEGANGFYPSPNLKVARTPDLFANSILDFLGLPIRESLEIPRANIYLINQIFQIEDWLENLNPTRNGKI